MNKISKWTGYTMKTTTQISTQTAADEHQDFADIHGGDATGLFTTSMTSQRGDMLTGEQTALFTTSMAPEGSTLSGGHTGLYTTSMTTGKNAHSGEATGLFTTSMSPKV
ncbi:conserved domain protein [Roseobacter denitrificans OCh 114]|uniref:Conserved domain protein n=2 Tax=Roseobacter denitrificans TaxID=2434 RepID=Q164B6_ROSDO|nr:conserved domain protein [Roseobacter denitrificans OCh 114]